MSSQRSLPRLLSALVTFRLARYEIAEDSMRPTLEPGDWCAGIKRPTRISPGDIVVFDHPERPGFEMVKRVVAAGPEGLTVEGEGPGSVDSRTFGPIPEEAVTARLLLVYRPRPMRWL